eukprot:EG_transcript_31911
MAHWWAADLPAAPARPSRAMPWAAVTAVVLGSAVAYCAVADPAVDRRTVPDGRLGLGRPHRAPRRAGGLGSPRWAMGRTDLRLASDPRPADGTGGPEEVAAAPSVAPVSSASTAGAADRPAPRAPRVQPESTDAVATFLTRRFGIAGGLAWLGFLLFGVLSEQIKTRLEVRRAEEGTRDVDGPVVTTP